VQSVLCHVTGQISEYMSLPSILFELFYHLDNFICALAEDRGLYVTHLNHMLTGQVVLHTGIFLGFFQGCGILTVLHYKMVLKRTAHKSTHTAEIMKEVLHLMKAEGLSMYKVSKQYHI